MGSLLSKIERLPEVNQLVEFRLDGFGINGPSLDMLPEITLGGPGHILLHELKVDIGPKAAHI